MAGFGFGGIKATANKKFLDKELVKTVVYDNFKENVDDYYIFLLSGNNRQSKIDRFAKVVSEKMGIESFLILNASSRDMTEEEIKKAGFAKFFDKNGSNWKDFINYKGKHVKAILPMGTALYALNLDASLKTEHFLGRQYFKGYYYLGDWGLGAINSVIFPIFSLEEILPDSNSDYPGCTMTWQTRFSLCQIQDMLTAEIEIPDLTPPKLEVLKTKEEAVQVLSSMLNSKIISWDTETNGLDFYTNKIHCVTISNDGINGYYIPWALFDTELKDLLTNVLRSSERNLGSNLKFDLKFMWKNDCCKGILQTDDTMQLSHSINCNRPKGLKEQAVLYTMFGGYETDLERFKAQTKIQDYSKIPTNLLSQYAILDVIVAFRVFEAQLKEIRNFDKKYPNEKNPEWSLEKHYSQILMPITRVFTEVEYNGFYINKPLMDKNKEYYKGIINDQIEILAKELEVSKDYPFSSTQKLGELFKSRGYPEIVLAKDGSYSTSDSCLSLWGKTSPERKVVTDAVSKMRSNQVFLKTFIGTGDENDPKGWEKHMRKTPEGDWKIHHQYSVMGTTTYRFKANSPNMQQVPTSESKLIDCIMPPFKDTYDEQGNFVERKTAYRLYTRDYSSFQCRLATIDTALIADGRMSFDFMDKALYNLYKKDSDMSDMHCQTSWALFGDSAKIPLIVAEDETGKVWKGDATTKVKTQRGVIQMKDLVETDTIESYSK